MICAIVEHRRVGIVPRFGCTYLPGRLSARSCARPITVAFSSSTAWSARSRFFPVVAAFYPASALISIASVRKPLVGIFALALVAGGAGPVSIANRMRTPRRWPLRG